MNRDILVSISEASKMLGVTEVTLRQWTDEGKIKAFVTPGGHRRYSQAELKKFIGSHRKTVGIRDLVAQLEDTAESHRELVRASMSATERYPKLTDETRQELTHLSRELLNNVVRYATVPAKHEETLSMARDTGRGFGEVLARMGLPLTDSVEMFVAHRNPIVSATRNLINRKEALSGRVIDAIPLATRVIDEALVALVAAYQQTNGKMTGKTKGEEGK